MLMQPPRRLLLLLLLLLLTAASSSSAERRLDDDDAPSSSCTTAMAPLQVQRHELLPGLFLSQEITTTTRPDTTSASASFLTIRLEYEGHGWLGFGFSPNGNSMVGSTVIIGLPDQPNEDGINPTKYYLADKLLSGIQAIHDDDSRSESESPSTSVPATASSTSATSVTSTASPTTSPSTAAPTTSPSTVTTIPSTNTPTTTTGTTMSASPSTSTTNPSDRPTSYTTSIPTESPTISLEQESSTSSKPTHWWEDPNWKRELRPAQEHRTLRIEPNASIEQNASHTILEFTRPLMLRNASSSLVPVFHDTEAEFDTVIFAVGQSNQLGYHGTMRGARSMLDESFATMMLHNCTPASYFCRSRTMMLLPVRLSHLLLQRRAPCWKLTSTTTSLLLQRRHREERIKGEAVITILQTALLYHYTYYSLVGCGGSFLLL